jgi:hypothetical protein
MEYLKKENTAEEIFALIIKICFPKLTVYRK